MHVTTYKLDKRFRPWFWKIENIPNSVRQKAWSSGVSLVGRNRTEEKAIKEGCKKISVLKTIAAQQNYASYLQTKTRKTTHCE